MRVTDSTRPRPPIVWAALGAMLGVPIIAAAASPLLAWRDPVYILGGLAGVVGLALLLVQPVLAGGYLPGAAPPRSRRLHRVVGVCLVVAVVVHVAALWITSPPDVTDALLFASPTPFSAWGVIAMWAVFASAALAALRRRMRLWTWRVAHAALAVLIVGGTVAHALLIDGTMETVTKTALCLAVLAATVRVLADLRTRMIRTGGGG